MARSRSAIVGVWLLLATASPVAALDPSKQITQYGHTAWRTKDGFFGGAPYAITQTTDGYIWIGTQAGVFRFDGVRFVPWTPPDGSRLPTSEVTSIYGARDGSLWIGTDIGVSRWANGRLVTYTAGRGRINGFVEDREGAVWYFRSRTPEPESVCQVSAANVRCYGTADGVTDPSPGSLVIDASGDLWIGGERSLMHGRPGRFRSYDIPALAPNANQAGVTAVALTPDRDLWVGIVFLGRGLGLRRFVDGALAPVVTPEFDGENVPVGTLLMDRDGGRWIGTTDRGLYRLHGDRAHRFRSTDGLSGDNILNLFEDREGNVWVVTSVGIDCFRDLRVTTWSSREGLKSNEVDGVLAARDGTIWIAGAGVLDAIRNDRVTSLTSGKGLPGNQVTSMFEDRQGQLWIGLDSTLTIHEHGRFTRVDMPDGRPVGMVTGITEDVAGNIWIEVIDSPRKLIRIRDRIVREVLSDPAVPRARKVAGAPDGGVWLGLMSGDLARWRDGRLETFAFKPPEVPEVGSIVSQLLVLPDGTVLGATTFGLIGWKAGTQRTLTVRNGLPCDRVFALIDDAEHDLWLYTQCGLMEIPSASLRDWWTNPDVIVRPIVLDIFDGAQAMFVPFNGAARSPDGRLWFATMSVVQTIDPAGLRPNAVVPPVHIEEVVADRRVYSPHDGLSLPPRPRDLQISYAALSFVVPGKVRFRYKLEGHDREWVDPGTRRQAFYNDLGPGNYRFHVMASNNDGVWNEAGALLRFTVMPAWHETQWFRAVAGLGILGVVWGAHRRRVHQIAVDLGARFDERLKERTRLARDLHDTLLQTIQASKLVVDAELLTITEPHKMHTAATEVSSWLGRAVQEGRAALNSLRTPLVPHGRDLPAALRQTIDDLAGRCAVRPVVHVVGSIRDVHPMVGEEITAIGREAIRNACLHSGGSHVDVELRYDANLTLRIQDNGRGMDPGVIERGRDGHFGIPGMRERAAAIGGTLELASRLCSGTELTLVVPGSVVFSRWSQPAYD